MRPAADNKAANDRRSAVINVASTTAVASPI